MTTPNIRLLLSLSFIITTFLLFSTTIVQAHATARMNLKETATTLFHLPSTTKNTTFSFKETSLLNDDFNKRKAKIQLKAAVGGVGKKATDYDILELHKAALQLIRQYPSAMAKIQKMTSSIAADVGYSLRFHENGESIIYGTLQPATKPVKEVEEEKIAIDIPTTAQQEIGGQELALALTAFPNPTTEQVTISLAGKAAPTEITMVDMSGKEVYHASLKQFDGHYQKTIDVGQLAKGVVTIYVKQGKQTVQQKVFVVR